MPRPSQQISAVLPIAETVRRAFAAELGIDLGHQPARARAAVSHTGESPAPTASTERAPAAAATTPAAPATPPATPPARTPSPQNDIVDRVRADLALAYEGLPVSPGRLAFRLQSDRDLVDAALMYLVTRREAKALGVRGKIGYVPVRTK